MGMCWGACTGTSMVVLAILYKMLGSVEESVNKQSSFNRSFWIRMGLLGAALPMAPIVMEIGFSLHNRMLSYEEAKIRIDPTNPGLLKYSKGETSVKPYEWRRSDGKYLSDPYDNYTTNLFVPEDRPDSEREY